MKIKVDTINGHPIDWAVAHAEGHEAKIMRQDHEYNVVSIKKVLGHDYELIWRPSTSWRQVGSLIEREHLSLHCDGSLWYSRHPDVFAECWGATPMLAACRAFLLYKLGPEIEVPDEIGGFNASR